MAYFCTIFSEKTKSRESIVLIEKSETISKEDEVANTLNNFFSNIVTNLNIPEHHVNALHHWLSNHPILKVILLKYKNHPSINTIRCAATHLSFIYFSQVEEKLIKEIKNLEISKGVQDSDIPVESLKENAEFFAK